MGVSTQQHVAHSYLPNIHTNPAEHLNILCSNAELFPNIKPIYAPRWSSQLPEAYLSSNGEITKSYKFKVRINTKREECVKSHNIKDKLSKKYRNIRL